MIDWLYARAFIRASPPALLRALFESFTLTIDFDVVKIQDIKIAPSFPIEFLDKSKWLTSCDCMILHNTFAVSYPSPNLKLITNLHLLK